MGLTSRLSRAIRSPRLFLRGINRLYHRRGFRAKNPDGLEVFDEDWDTLVVLDACRYDMFESTNWLDGSLSSRISKGSSTVEWLQANFDGRDLRDTVYVTANPQLEENRDRWDIQLHETINVWLEDGWDDETGTVRAETVTEAALDASKQFPHKRLVAHYMQPHYPFVLSDTTFDKEHLSSIDGDGSGPEGENVWGQKFSGQIEISDQDLWSMYVENLEYVLEHVEVLLESISGKTVITSDHGNYVGERSSPIPIREYGHPRGIYDDVLVRVPWLEFENGRRRQVQNGAPSKEDNLGPKSDIIKDRLRDLGYKE